MVEENPWRGRGDGSPGLGCLPVLSVLSPPITSTGKVPTERGRGRNALFGCKLNESFGFRVAFSGNGESDVVCEAVINGTKMTIYRCCRFLCLS